MKIAIFHNLPIGGAKRVLFEEVKGLAKKHKLHLFTMISSDRDQMWGIEPYMDKVYRYDFIIDSKLPGFLARMDKDIQNYIRLKYYHKKIAEKINNDGYDVVLTHADRFTQTPFVLRYLKIPNAYYCMELMRVAYEEELEFTDEVVFIKRWYELFTRQVRKNIDLENAKATNLIIAISKFTKGDIKGAYGTNSPVCYPGVDTKVFKPSSEKQEGLVLYVGPKIAIEGYDLAKESFDVMIKKYKNKFSKNIKPKFEVVSFGGKGPKITDEMLVKKYSQTSVCLVPTMNETFGLIPLEAMACETPVIALDEAAPKETMINRKTGYLCNREPKEIADKLYYLLTHKKLQEKMGKFARKHVEKNFTWKMHVNCIEKHLKHLTGK